MLELIVLGSVPGTQFTITFFQALLGLLGVALIGAHFREAKKSLEIKNTELEGPSL